MNIRRVWLFLVNADRDENLSKPTEHILDLDHVSIGGQFQASGYIVREKQGSTGGPHRPVERLLTVNPMRYSTALKYWRERAAWCIRNGYTAGTASQYRNRDFTDSSGWPPDLDNPMLESLSQLNEHVHNHPPDRELPPQIHTCPLPPLPPITLPPYTPPVPISNTKPPQQPAAFKPKPKPARRLPLSTARRITLED